MEWLKAAKVFESVVHSGSLSAAARKRGLSPASVSRHINDLETELGVRLLNRTSRRLSLTEAGRIYFDKVEAIILQIADAENAVQQLTAVPQGVLRVHSRMLVGEQYIVPALKRFTAQHPDIRFDLQMSNFPVDIVSQGIDIDIRIGKLADSSLVARKLATSRRLLVATPGYLAGMPPIQRPRDLMNHSCLSYRLNLGGSIWRFRKDGYDAEEVQVKGFLQSDNGRAILTACEGGLGIAMMNDWSVKDQLANGSLHMILADYDISFTDFESGIYAVFQKSTHLPLKTRAFVDFLGKEFRARLGH
ncbi:LysR family transcriptional regulator [Loktanella sp. M215]|uniref:LysR family transcriptional regulator n=1 Tax=Loktanella sp. M215 TaxID=2675431 RepID=UPI001F1D48E6|nr:LysR family transcriptional regulator [Loktanella sp. M215]MCF7701793.1 LysR family transcriptional regulator [Loktanella sp. M215]